jgi:formylglycine-generating enzyme required for sulfatase activity
LFNPDASKDLQSARFAEDKRLADFEAHMREGERSLAAADWALARNEFEAALRIYPNHKRAGSRLALAKRRLAPALSGFEVIGDRFDPETGLPLHVRVTGVPMEMVLIRSGDADLGDDRLPGSRPVHTVSIRAFYLATTELTQSNWLAIKQSNPSVHRGEKLPVHNVSWTDAQEWIDNLNKRIPGGGFRMPTEAEWEYAARSGSNQPDLRGRAWYRENSASTPPAGDFRQIDAYAPHAAGSLQPDSRGIHDLAGNVWEWCSTVMKPYPYDSRDGRESREASGLRVLRGGGFADSADYLNPSFRHAERPDRRLMFNGVRLARTIPDP